MCTTKMESFLKMSFKRLAVSWSPDGTIVALTPRRGNDVRVHRIRGIETRTLKNSYILPGHDRGRGAERLVHAATWSPDGKRMATGCSEKAADICIWDVERREIEFTLCGNDVASVSTIIVWTQDGKFIAVGSDDGHLRVFDVEGQMLFRNLDGHDGTVLAIAWSPDTKTITSACSHNMIKTWDVETGECKNTEYMGGYSLSLSFSPDCKRIAMVKRSDSNIQIHDTSSSDLVRIITPEHKGSDMTACVAWSPDGVQLASSGRGRTVSIWNADTGERLHSANTKPSYDLQLVAWSPNATHLSCYEYDSVRTWYISPAKEHEDALRNAIESLPDKDVQEVISNFFGSLPK